MHTYNDRTTERYRHHAKDYQKEKEAENMKIDCPVCGTELRPEGDTRPFYKCRNCGYHKIKEDGNE